MIRALAILLLCCCPLIAQVVIVSGTLSSPPTGSPASPWLGASNSEVITFTNNIVAASGTISSNDMFAVDQFVSANKSSGAWSYLKDGGPLLADSQPSLAAVKLIAHPNAQTNKVAPVNGGAYTHNQGFWLTNNQYLWPGIVTSNSMLSSYSNGVAIWITGFCNTNTRGWFYGTENTGAQPLNYLWAGLNAANGEVYETHAAFGGNSETFNVTTLATAGGMIGHSRTNLDAVKMFINGVGVLTNSTSISVVNEANSLWLIGARSAGSPPASGAPDSLPGSFSVGYYMLDSGLPWTLQTNYYNSVRQLMASLGRVPQRTYPRKAFVISGQSNSYGAGGDSSANFYLTKFDNLVGGSGAWFFAGPNFANSNYPSLRAQSSELGSTFSGWTAFADQLSSFSYTNGSGASNDCIYEAFGLNGINIGNYTAGSSPFYGSTNWAYVQNAYESNTFGQNLVFPAVFIVGGESDGQNAAYGNSLRLMRGYYESAFSAINGQTNIVSIFFSQNPAHATGEPYENYSMLSNHINLTNNYLSGPRYQYSYSAADHIHMDNIGLIRQREKEADAYWSVQTRGWWEPLRPISLIVTNNNQILAVFTNCSGGLVLDKTSFWWTTNHANYGFTYSDSGSTTISSVQVQATNTVLLTMSGSIAGTSARKLSYGVNSITNSIYCAGTLFGPGGNLRNSNPATGFVSTSNLWDWCVVFTNSVPYP